MMTIVMVSSSKYLPLSSVSVIFVIFTTVRSYHQCYYKGIYVIIIVVVVYAVVVVVLSIVGITIILLFS